MVGVVKEKRQLIRRSRNENLMHMQVTGCIVNSCQGKVAGVFLCLFVFGGGGGGGGLLTYILFDSSTCSNVGSDINLSYG